MKQETTLFDVFIRTQRLMHQYFMLRRNNESGMDSQHGQGRIIFTLQKTGAITQKELTKILDIRQQSIGELLQKLEEKGYVSRQPLESDRRTMEISLTESGKAFQFSEQPIDDIFIGLSEQEQDNLKQYLEKINKNLESQMKELDMSTLFDRRRPNGGRDFDRHNRVPDDFDLRFAFDCRRPNRERDFDRHNRFPDDFEPRSTFGYRQPNREGDFDRHNRFLDDFEPRSAFDRRRPNRERDFDRCNRFPDDFDSCSASKSKFEERDKPEFFEHKHHTENTEKGDSM